MIQNKELRLAAACFLAIAAAAGAAGYAVSPAAGILAVVTAAACGMVFFVFTRERYQGIARISEQIDRVLHDADCLYISESEEGELSILQSEITKMTLRIREQNRMLVKEKQLLADSLADIAHQLRTPLTSVNLILTLLENNPDENGRRELLRETEELLARMDWLITSLLKLSRLDAGIVEFQCGQVSVQSLVESSLNPFLISMELHNISLQADVPDGIEISGDFQWLSQAVQNILKNCMESAGDGGRIEISCEKNMLFTEISIHDSGAGFKDSDIPRLFDRFYRGRTEKAAGYGIGLALCRTIITRMGGTVTAENHPEGGAVFYIRFQK